MALKKSDKLIAIIGVIILIVAAVGIFLYADLEEEKPPEDNEGEMKTYEIYYDEISRPATPDNQEYSIKAKLLGKGSYEGVVEISQQNLKSVEIFVEYHDNKAGLLWRFGRVRFIGADKITISISDSQGNEFKESIKGDGNETITVKTDGEMISLEPIEAEDIMTANEILEQNYIDNSETYTIHITLKTGLWGKIRELLGRDHFNLDITYTYYDYYLEEVSMEEDFDEEFPPAGNDQGSQIWTPMAYPGKN